MKKISFRVRNFDKEQFLTFNIDNDAELDEDLLDFLEEEEPEGIVPVIFEEDDEFDTFSYDITDKIHLCELSAQEINAEMVLLVLRGVVISLMNMSEYRIPLSYLVLNRNYIYIDSDYKVEFVCIPLEDMKEEVDLTNFFRNFIASLRFEPSENGDYVAKLLTYVNNRTLFNLRNMLSLIEEWMDNLGIDIPDDNSNEIYGEYQEIIDGDSEDEVPDVEPGTGVVYDFVENDDDMPGDTVEDNASEDSEKDFGSEESGSQREEPIDEEESVSAIDVSAVEEAAEEKPVIDAEVIEETAKEEPVIDAEALEETVEEESVIDAEAVEETAEEEPVIDVEAVEEAEDEEPVIDATAIEESEAEKPAINAAAAKETEAEEPVVDAAVAEETTVNEPVVEPVAKKDSEKDSDKEKSEKEESEKSKESNVKPDKDSVEEKTKQNTKGAAVGVVIEDDLDEFLAEKEKEDMLAHKDERNLKMRSVKVNRASIVQSTREEIEKEHEEEDALSHEADNSGAEKESAVEASGKKDSKSKKESKKSEKKSGKKDADKESNQNADTAKETENNEAGADEKDGGSIISQTIGNAANTIKNAAAPSAVPKVNPYLIRVNTDERIMITKQTFKLGKASMGVDYSISGNGAISRVHAIITGKDGEYSIKDNKSTNHTFVNGKSVEEGENVPLTNNCKIVLGDEEFVFKLQ